MSGGTGLANTTTHVKTFIRIIQNAEYLIQKIAYLIYLCINVLYNMMFYYGFLKF